MDQQEGLDQAPCDAETGEPGVLMLSCDLPKGHEGDHCATYDWPREKPSVPRENRYLPPAWLSALYDAQARSFLLSRRDGSAAAPTSAEIARLFAEANDRPDHMGPA